MTWPLAHCGGGLLQQSVVDAQRQAIAGLAIGAVAEGLASEPDDVLTGGVAVENLEQEQIDGHNRVEEALASATRRTCPRMMWLRT